MGRRSDHSREELHDLALTAARTVAEREGLRGVTARRVAREIGYTVGTLYNLFDDLDDLIVHLNGRTLDALYQACAAGPLDSEPEIAVQALAERYIRFTREHPKLWNLLFEHHLPEGRELPDWYHEKIRRLFGLVELALAPLFPPGEETERHKSARVLWSSLHGICSLETAGKLAVSVSVDALAEALISNYLAGLQVRAAF